MDEDIYTYFDHRYIFFKLALRPVTHKRSKVYPRWALKKLNKGLLEAAAIALS